MADDTALGTVVLGLEGFVLLEAREVDGEVELAVETMAVTTGCPECGVVARAHGRRATVVRDVAMGGRPCRLAWSKRLWRCEEQLCPKRTWTERRDDAALPRAVLTERARAHVCVQVGRHGRPVAQLAREFGTGWNTAMAAVRDHGLPLTEDPARTAGVASLGVDETSFQAAGPRRRTTFVTGLVDLDTGRLLDVVDGRAGTSVAGWLQQRGDGWLSAVRRVALDPHRGYLNALLEGLDAPTAVVDAFHVIKLANTVVDEVRRRVQQDEMGHRGHKGDPLYGIRRTLLVGTERLTDKGKARLEAALVAGDPDCEVWYAHHVKELLRRVYRADAHDEAADRLEEFHEACQFVEIPEIRRLARTLRHWHHQLLSYWRCDGLSNGKTEAINALIKRIKRVGHGFRNLANYRLRLLLFCGKPAWQDQPAARLRGPRHAS